MEIPTLVWKSVAGSDQPHYEDCFLISITLLQLVSIASCTFACARPRRALLCLPCNHPPGWWRQQEGFSLSLLPVSPSALRSFSLSIISACCFKGLLASLLTPAKQKGVSKALLLQNHGRSPEDHFRGDAWWAINKYSGPGFLVFLHLTAYTGSCVRLCTSGTRAGVSYLSSMCLFCRLGKGALSSVPRAWSVPSWVQCTEGNTDLTSFVSL